jgi:hypothetical protein
MLCRNIAASDEEEKTGKKYDLSINGHVIGFRRMTQ